MKKILVFASAMLMGLSLDAQQKCNGSLLFDNSNDIAVNLPSTNQYYSAGNGGYTWECWFKLNSAPGSTSNDRCLISAIDWTLYEDMYLGFGWHGGVQNRGYDSLVFKVDPPSMATPVDQNCAWAPSTGFNVGQWYHVVAVADYNAKRKFLYVDCKLVDAQPLTVAPNTRVIPTNLSACSACTGVNSLDGYMDEVRIWDKPLSPDDINCDKCLTGTESNLFLYYRCNQVGALNVLDATANFNDGTFLNPPSPGWATANAPVNGDACCDACKCLGSLDFDEDNVAVNLPITNQYYTDANGGYTWECWFKLHSAPGSVNYIRPLISAIDWTTFEDNYLGFGWDGGWYDVSYDSLVFKVDGPSSATPTGPNCTWKPAGGFVVGQWYHAAGVMDYINDEAKLYVNGILRDTKPVTVAGNPRAYQTNLSSWGSGDPNNTLDGLMDEVRIWDRVLGPTEIAANYNRCRAGTESNLVVYYRCNQVGASNVIDGSGNVNTGNFLSLPGKWSTENAPVTGTCKKDCNRQDDRDCHNSNNPDGKMVGIEKQINQHAGLKIYPNPSSGTIKVSSEQPGVLALYSVTGQLISEIKVHKSEHEVKLQGIKPGVYLYVFSSESSSSSGKLIIE